MKRVLISAVAAGALLGQLNAFEVYKDGDKSFGVFGVANALVGYGLNFSNLMNGTTIEKNSKKTNGEFISGIQGNSRIGINFTVGKVFGAALIGVGEKTLRGQSIDTGFRQLYAGYDFGDAGKLLAGKNELVTSMGGFSSSIFDTESGLHGFGGVSTSTRRLQIAYSVAGLTFSISENDLSTKSATGQYYEIPRFSVGYEYKDSSIRAKVAAAYAHQRTVTNKNAFFLTAGIKPTFGDSYVSALLSYGFNADKFAQNSGDMKIATPSLGKGFGNAGVSTGNTQTTQTNLVGVVLEYGVNLTDDLGFKIGAGYQYAHAQNVSGDFHSYAGFVQLPYKVGGGFSIIPQVGYLGTTIASTTKNNEGNYVSQNAGNFLAEVLFKIAF